MGSEMQQQEIRELLAYTGNDKVERMLALYRAIGVDAWANSLKQDYLAKALQHLEDTPVLHARKQPLFDLAQYLIQRDV
jgi:geranylgeranyl diphosphate synthase type II